jgi:hypothetical protein
VSIKKRGPKKYKHIIHNAIHQIKERVMKRTIQFFISFCFFFALNAHADIGQKPSMKFIITYDVEQKIEIVEAKQIQCNDKDCTVSSPLEELGPQRFKCDKNECRSLAYGYKKYQKLKIKFSDKYRESNIFTTNNFKARFTLIVKKDCLVVTENEPEMVKKSNTK